MCHWYKSQAFAYTNFAQVMSLTKSSIHKHCLQEVKSRMQSAINAMASLRESVAADTKSSMGDKYETSREMAQQELEKISRQIAMLQQWQGVFAQIQSGKLHEIAGIGALVQTNNGLFWLAAPMGKINIQNTEVMIISPQSPAGKSMIGKKSGDSFELNGNVFQILSVT
jgi:hypothetical protein